MKPTRGNSSPKWNSTFAHHSPSPVSNSPPGTVPDHRLVARPSHWPRQQLRDVSLQALVGPDADRALHAPLFQHLVDLRLADSTFSDDTAWSPTGEWLALVTGTFSAISLRGWQDRKNPCAIQASGFRSEEHT